MRNCRFRFFALLITGSIGILAIAPAEGADILRVRRGSDDLNAADQQLFIDAMYAMKAAPARGNGTLANNRYDEYVRLHEIFRNHMNSGFLPWHRKMLWEFESEIRQLDPVKFGNFTLPYWNLNFDFFPDYLVGAGGNPILVDGPFAASHWTTVNPGEISGLHALERNFFDIGDFPQIGSIELLTAFVLLQPDFEMMSMRLEINWHNYTHNAVGGQFATIAGAVDDPFFWLLHSWVDMVWALWQARTGSTTADDYMPFMDGPGLDELMSGFGDLTNLTDIGFNSTMFNTVRDQLDPRNTTSLGYNYEFLGQMVLPPVAVPEPRSLVLAALSIAALAGSARARRQSR